jgi:subtilisin family serine protease
VVRFHENVPLEEIQRIARELGLSVLRPIPYAGNTFLLAWPGGPSYHTLQIAQALRAKYPVRYAEPNVLMPLVRDQYTPNDPLWADLTHLTLMNCDDAWQALGDIDPNSRGGSAGVTIAVLDQDGVAPNHTELTATLTDGTSKLVTSYNFVNMTLQTVPQLDGDHGTQCAGTATAAFDNNRGIAGVAPNCHLIGARILNLLNGVSAADALIWAAGLPTGNPSFPPPPTRPADVISNSWGVNGLVLPGLMRDCFDFIAVYGRSGRGCVVVFSIGNNGYNSFMTGSFRRDFAAYERTVAVGASINLNPTSPVNSIHPDPSGANNINVTVDTRALYSPYGAALDVVAPGHTAYAAGSGDVIDPILGCVRVGTGDVDGCPGASVCNDYEASFGGTSHAAPAVAGVAALILSVNPGLSWVEVREILRGTAKRIDSANTNSIGAYVDNDGDGIREFSQWYGYGRIDAAAAVKAARDRVFAADIVVRENLADDGSVPSAGWHAHSPDIWVRRTDDPIPTLGYSSDPPHQNPRRNQDNYVFCRVKNVGTTPGNEAYVRAMITHFPGFEFRYPQEFIPANRPGDSVLSPITPGTYLIGEVRIDNLAVGASRIVKMRWPQALIPPEQVDVGGTMVSWHPCLLIEASPHDGPMPSGTTFDIKRDNNIAQRNLTILDPGEPTSDLFHAIVAGTSDPSGIEAIYVDRSGLSADARVFVRLADPRLMHRWLRLMKESAHPSWEHSRSLAELSEKGDPCEIRVLTAASLAVTCHGHRSVIVHARPGTRIEMSCSSAPVPVEIKGGVYRGLDAIEIDSANAVVEIPLRLEQSVFAHLLVGVTPSANGEELRLTQRRGSGELSAGYTIAF